MCQSPSAEGKKKKQLGNTVEQVVWENDEIRLVSGYGSCLHSMNVVSQPPMKRGVGEEK